MALRAGELMVIIRAQDFASRTLRRVGAEFAGLSREQAIAARQADLTFRREQALLRRQSALANQKPLRIIQRRNDLYDVQQRALKDLAVAQDRLNRLQSMRTRTSLGTFGPRTPAQTAAITMTQREIQGLNKAVDMSTHQLTRLDQVINGLGTRYMKLRDSSFAFGQAQRAANAQLSAAYGALDANTRAQIGFNNALAAMPVERLDRTAHVLSGLGRTAQLFGAVGTAAFGLTANAAADFNTEMSLAGTQARDIGAGFEQVNLRVDQMSNGFRINGKEIGGVLDLMNKYPATSQEMSAATYDIFSSMNLERDGVMDVAKGLGLLEDANKIAVAGGGSLEEATNAMITVLNNFDPQLKNTTAQFDTMFDIVRFGRMRLSEFNIMMNKIAPAAADAGNTLEDVGGAMAFLTTVMPSQRMVATGISRLLEALRHPDVVKGLKMFGVEAKDATGKLRPLDKLIVDIAEHFPQLRTGQMSAADFFREVSAAGRGGGSKGVIFTQEGRRALSQIVTHLDQYLQRQRQIQRNTGEFNQSLQAQQQALGVQWDVFQNRLRAIVLQIGTDAIPAFTQIGDVLSKMLDAWNKLDPSMRQAIVRFAVFASVGTLIAGVGASIFGSLLALEAMLKRLRLSGAGATGSLTGLWMVLRRLAAVAAISTLIKIAVTGDATAMDIITNGIAGALIGSKYGKAGFVKGGIIFIAVTFITGGILDEPTQNFDKKLKDWGNRLKGFELFGAHPTRGLGELIHGVARLDEKMQGVKDSTDGAAKSRRDGQKLDQKILNDWRRGVNQATKTENARIDAFKKYRNAVKKYNDELATFKDESRQYEQDLEQWHKQLRDTTAQARVDAVSNLRNMYMEMEQANRQAFGELFQGPWLTSETFDLAQEWGITPRIQDMIKDLRMQNNAFAKWRGDLDKIMKKGLPSGFIDEIRNMGIEQGQPFIDQILKASPQQVNNLIAQYKRREGQIKSATKMDFVDEINRFKTAGGRMGDAIINGFKEAQVGMWFDGWIKSTFPGVINAAVNEAVSQWKQGSPRPTAPTRPPKPTPPTIAAGGAAAANKITGTPWTPNIPPYTDALGRTDNYNFHFHGDARVKEETMRQAAFIARNAFRGAFK